MQILTETVSNLKVGSARTFEGLTVFPLTGPEAAGAPYRTLDEAVTDGTVRITEISDAGSVPDLKLTNNGDRPVLALDGEELTGAKQNRILNLTILVPAGKTLIIPVSCVEAGRWAAESREFSLAMHVTPSRMRGNKMAHVSASLRASGMRSTDQHAVWDDVARYSEEHEVHSATSKMQDVFEARRTRIDDYVRAFEAVHDQVGAAFAVAGRIAGAELFDSRSTLRQLLPKLVRSWAMEAMTVAGRAHDVPPREAVRDFLEEIGSADASAHAAIGLGDDVRLTAPRLVGGALQHDGRVVHLCAFRTGDPGRTGRRSHEGRIERAFGRARRRE